MSNVYIKTRVRSGEGALAYLNRYKNKNIFIVCDKFLKESGAVGFVLDQLDNSSQITIFDDVVPDPTIEVVGKGLGMASRTKPEIIIGFGGGSAIDTAKGIIYIGYAKKLLNPVLFITIPTTSGTGSEVTSATVLTDPEDKSKHLIDDESVLADVAILDPRLTLSVPQAITANTGMDVFTHALEAYVAKGANVFSDALAEKAVELILQSLLICYYRGQDIEARSRMHEASTLAGMAFDTAGLGMNHSIAHQLGGVFHIPHGLANALLLEEVIDYNCQDKAVLEKYAKLARKTGMAGAEFDDSTSVTVLKTVICTLMKYLKMPGNIRDLNILKEEYEEHMELMAENALKDRCIPSSPLPVQKSDIIKILKNLY